MSANLRPYRVLSDGYTPEFLPCSQEHTHRRLDTYGAYLTDAAGCDGRTLAPCCTHPQLGGANHRATFHPDDL